MTKVSHRIRALDPGFIIVLLLCALAAWPFISRSSLPQETDAELHIFRLAELARLFNQGEFFPRWAPNFYYGYGYPIFNYYAPLSYYLALPIALIPGLGAVAGIKAAFIFGILGAGFGMYGYVRGNWGRSAGVITAAAAVLSPYVLYIDPHARGDVAESMSIAFFALTLWALDRLRRRPSRWNWLASVFLPSGLILSHNLMSFIFLGLLLAWAFWHVLFNKVPDENRPEKIHPQYWKWRLILAIFIAGGITSFFWMTVLLEQGAVNLDTLIGQGGHYDFRSHFLSIQELLSLNKIIDWGASEPAFFFNLGLGQWIFTGIGLIMLVLKKCRKRVSVTFFAAAFIIFIILMLPISTIIWSTVPFMAFIQFPWRLLGPVSLIAAIIAGSGYEALEEILPDKARPWSLAAAAGIITLTALPLLQVSPWPDDFGPTTAKRVLEIELDGRWLGTTSTADFVPATVDVVPRPNPSMVDDYMADREIDRVNRATLPEGTAVRSEIMTPLHFRFSTESAEPFLLRLFLFRFPGWQARIDDQPLLIELGRPEGFMVLPVPDGDHLVELEFKSTVARTFSKVITLLFLLGFGLTLWLLPNQPSVIEEKRSAHQDLQPQTSILPAAAAISLVIILQIVAGDGLGLLNRHSMGLTVEEVEYPLNVEFEGGIRLLGYDLNETNIKEGDDLEIGLFWKTDVVQDQNYQVFVHLLDSKGDIVAQSDKLNPGDFPTERWPTDKYIFDDHHLLIPDFLPDGLLEVGVGLWNAGEGERLFILDQEDDIFLLPAEIGR